MFNICGYKRLTVSGVVGDSGKSQLIAGYGVESGGTVGVATFFDGTSTAGTRVFNTGPSVINQGSLEQIVPPVSLPFGCFVSFDSNVTAVTVFYIQNATN